MNTGQHVVSFSDAKNGEKTAALNGKHVHSAYNPSREAAQFVARLSAPFKPTAVVIIEPALSYCAPYLRSRFSDAACYAIRLTHDFSDTDGAWDACFYADAEPLADQLYRQLGEEALCAALFFSWPSSEQIFPAQTTDAWNAIKAAVLKSRDVLATRSFFAKRWIKNAVTFCARVQHPAVISPGNSDIVVAASGPSLRTSLAYLRLYRNQFFLIAVSSALLPLLHAGIRPDLVLSTDGGYWAKRHLTESGYDATGIPFALAAEGACPAVQLATHTVVPLCYADGIEQHFFAACTLSAVSACRNGTVSGTAAEFALALTSGNVYMCGLDLASARGFQHTQPNALEQRSAETDSRLRPKETRSAIAEYGAHGSLELYRAWFAAQSARMKNRLFRLSDNVPFQSPLGQIADCNWQDFTARHDAKKNIPPVITLTDGAMPLGARKTALLKAISDVFATDTYNGEVCPVETLMEKRAATAEERERYAQTITEKKTSFVQELEKLLYD